MTSAGCKGLILILSSPSGGGKTSLSKKLISCDNNLKLSISATTRAPRPEEIEGADYFFKTTQEFESLITQNLLLEHTHIYNNYYGTLKKYADDVLIEGTDLLFNIDWRGASSIKQNMPNQTITVFLLPPSLEVLEQRLIKRSQDSIENIKNRLSTAKEEITHAKNYDYVLINDDFNQTCDLLKSILNVERCKRLKIDNLSKYL